MRRYEDDGGGDDDGEDHNRRCQARKNIMRTMKGFTSNLWMRRCDNDGGGDDGGGNDLLIRLKIMTISSKKNNMRRMKGFILNLWMRRCDHVIMMTISAITLVRKTIVKARKILAWGQMLSKSFFRVPNL